MSKIKIRNFGPIKEGFDSDDGWMDVKKVTVFIGNQGSGKSSVAKLISTFTWIEKVLTRGDYDIEEFTTNNKFREHYCSYHRIDRYFYDVEGNDITEIEYEGDSLYMNYKNAALSIQDKKNGYYPLPQIMYVPADRNLLANIDDAGTLRLAAESLGELREEFYKARKKIKGLIKLPINNAFLEYDSNRDILFIIGKVKENDYRVRLTDASSGFQSLVPMYLVSDFLANFIDEESKKPSETMKGAERERFRKSSKLILEDNNLSDEQKRILISELSKSFNKNAFINIVEEPEQNLFPTSQREMLNSLIAFNNINPNNKLILTTHSPYIINYLTLAVKASLVSHKILNSNKDTELYTKLNEIVPLNSIVAPEDWVIYELTNDGKIIKIANYNDLPSDNNYLNKEVAETNYLFDDLLEIEKKCQ